MESAEAQFLLMLFSADRARQSCQHCLYEWGTANLEIEGLKCDYWPGLRIEFANLGLRLD